MVIGVTGFILCVVADYIKNKDLRAASLEPIPFDEDEEPASTKLVHKQTCLCLNISGYICMFASLLALWYYGYFDPYIAMLFG